MKIWPRYSGDDLIAKLATLDVFTAPPPDIYAMMSDSNPIKGFIIDVLVSENILLKHRVDLFYHDHPNETNWPAGQQKYINILIY